MIKPVKFFRSLSRAAGALVTALREEQNFRIQSVAAATAIAGSLILGVAAGELALVVGAAGMVLSLELVNSAAERLVDMALPRVHHYAAVVKNLMAAAVLTAALAALAVTLLVWWPYLAAL